MPEDKLELPDLNTYNSRKYADLSAYPLLYIRSGVACPNCGEELVQNGTGMVFLSNPPQVEVKCLKCNFVGKKVL